MKSGITFLAAIAAVVAGAQAPTIRIVVSGSEMHFSDQPPTQSGGRVLVPLRGVFEQLGAVVDWDPATQTVTAHRRNSRVVLTVGQLDASVNGHDVHLDVAANIVGGSTMVPLRFVSEALGAYVTWDESKQEVDITPGGDYNLPREAPPRQAPPLPPQPRERDVVVRVPSPPAERVVYVIPADSVLPLVLTNRLTSFDARPGDRFSATLISDGEWRGVGLPQGTRVDGRVSYARPRRGNEPGLLELQFDQLVTPEGHRFAVSGRLIGLDSAAVARGDRGLLIAKDTVRNDRVFFTGYGPRVGVIIGLPSRSHIGDIEISERLSRTVSHEVQHRQVNDVELAPGTRLGLRLYQDLKFPRGIR